jgi:hypothetical protein
MTGMRRWVVWVGIAVLVLLGGYFWASRNCDRPASSGSTAGPVSTDPAAAAEYWTPERMASARPAEMPVGEPRSC